MKHDTYNNITKWSGRAATGLALIITAGLAIGGIAFIFFGLVAMAFFDGLSAFMLFGSGSLFLCLGVIGLVRQLREQSLRLQQAYVVGPQTT